MAAIKRRRERKNKYVKEVERSKKKREREAHLVEGLVKVLANDKLGVVCFRRKHQTGSRHNLAIGFRHKTLHDELLQVNECQRHRARLQVDVRLGTHFHHQVFQVTHLAESDGGVQVGVGFTELVIQLTFQIAGPGVLND